MDEHLAAIRMLRTLRTNHRRRTRLFRRLTGATGRMPVEFRVIDDTAYFEHCASLAVKKE